MSATMPLRPDSTKDNILSVSLLGTLRVLDPDNNDLTPKGSKSCGLIAILLLTEESKRSRRWIEGKLWSTRSADQASSSMRQCLVEIRKSLGAYSSRLYSDRRNVWFDPQSFRLDIDLPSLAPERVGSLELLEGLRIRDPEFIEWLEGERRHFRKKFASTHTPASSRDDNIRPKILIPMESEAICKNENRIESIIQLQVTKNLHENSNFMVLGNRSIVSTKCGLTKDIKIDEPFFELVAKARIVDGEHDVSLALMDVATSEIHWIRRLKLREGLTFDGDREDLLFQIAQEASDVSHQKISESYAIAGGPAQYEVLVNRALSEIFSFDGARLRIADGLLKAAYDKVPNPLLLAWRSFIRMIIHVERIEHSCGLVQREAFEFIEQAIKDDSANSMILAIASLVYAMLPGESPASERMAMDALALNSGSAMSNLAMGAVALRKFDNKNATECSNRALTIARHTPYKHWFYMFSCLVDINCKNYHSAIKNAEAAIAYEPGFRAPLRHLYALYLKIGDHKSAIESRTRLRQLEPDFSLELIRTDESYPAAIIRSSALIDVGEPEV